MLIELKGINIAATTGIKFPVTANVKPTMLYSNERTKLHFITFIPRFEIFIKLGITLKAEASKIPSHAGEKTLISFPIVIPR